LFDELADEPQQSFNEGVKGWISAKMGTSLQTILLRPESFEKAALRDGRKGRAGAV
jgi:hypothetical protein